MPQFTTSACHASRGYRKIIGYVKVIIGSARPAWAKALGLGSGWRAFPRFLESSAMAGALGAELEKKVGNPLVFQWDGRSAGDPPRTIHGFDATLLIDICNAIIAAEASGSLKAARYANL